MLAHALAANGEVQNLRLSSEIVAPLICAISPDGTRLIMRNHHYIVALSLDQKRLMLFDRARQHWSTLADNGAGDPAWSSDSHSIFFQNFLEPGDPIYRLDLTAALPTGPAQKIATLADLFNAETLDYRL